MKRIINIIILTLFLMVGVNAITLSTNQDNNIVDYTLVEKGNTFFDNVVGALSTTRNQKIEFNNGSIVYPFDYKLEYKSLNENFYLIVQSYEANETITLMWRGDLQQDGKLYVQNFTFQEVGGYYFKFSPEYENEPAVIYIEFPDDYVGTFEYIEEKPQTFTIIARTILDGGMKLVDINVLIWKGLFYTGILAVMISVAFGLFAIAFILISYSRKIQNGGDK